MNDADLAREQEELDSLRRRTELARRRHLVALYPVRGRLARLRWFGARARARVARAPTTPSPDPVVTRQLTSPSDSSPTVSQLAALGLLRGACVEVAAELAKAELDLSAGFVDRWAAITREWRTGLIGTLRGVPRRVRRPSAPKVSVVTTTYATPPALLRACLRSVSRQTFTNLEHVVVDDASPGGATAARLRRAARWDRRRIVVQRTANGGIVAAGNDALAAARGDVVVFLDHDDLLIPSSVAQLLAPFGEHPRPVLVYGDHDLLTPDRRRIVPFFKPDFSPERLRAQNYITHPMVADRAAVRQIGGLREQFDGAQDHDLALRLGEVGPVRHVAGVLYHWRQAPGSVSLDPDSKPYAFQAGVRAVADHCERLGIDAEVLPTADEGRYTVRRRLRGHPAVSAVIPTRGTTSEWAGADTFLVVAAVRSMLERSTYPLAEVVVVADEATPEEVLHRLADLAGPALRVVPWTREFNFSAKCNLGASIATGEVLLFLNDDTRLVEPSSIEEMLGLLQDSDVGAVGAKLLYPDGTVQHGGHVYADRTEHALTGWHGDSPGPWRMLRVPRECSGVTAAALAIRSDVFAANGGFDEAFPSNFNDVDLCLRLRAAGFRILWTPAATWIHYESASREPTATAAEAALLTGRWAHELRHDPYFNPFLQPQRSDWVPRPLHSGVGADTYRTGGHRPPEADAVAP